MKRFIMKGFVKKILAVALLFAASGVFADSWHICLGSYSTREGAVELRNLLARKNIETFVSKFEKSESEVYYRVLYSERFGSREKGMEKKRQLESDANFRRLGIRNVWCAKIPGPGPRPEIRREPEVKEVLVERIVEIIREVPVEVEKTVTVEKIVELIKEVPAENKALETEILPGTEALPETEVSPETGILPNTEVLPENEPETKTESEFVEPECYDAPPEMMAEE